MSRLEKPSWIRVKAPTSIEFHHTSHLVKTAKLNTVCEEASCPNIGECWAKKHVTIMILGTICTRACKFCDVATGMPDKLDPHEPLRTAEMLAKLDLAHVVITSVDRDDLPDGGAGHFAQTIQAIRQLSPQTTIEVLTPDFLRKNAALEKVIAAKPDVYNHNVETAPRLYGAVRPGARYYHSINLLHRVKQMDDTIFTKSGMMVGLGEDKTEIYQVMDDLRAADVDFLTIGQYLQPSSTHYPVQRYVSPDEFNDLEKMAYGKGFSMVSASPLTRSSYHADADFAQLRQKKLQQSSV